MRDKAIPHISDNDSHQTSILVVDESETRLKLLIAALSKAGYSRVHALSNSTELHQFVRETKPDVVLIDVESPSRDTLEQLKLIRDQDPTPVLMVAQDPKAQSIQEAVASGVCAYSVGDVSTVRVKHAIEVAMATFASFKMLRDQLARAREQLSEQKRIDRAKCYLIEQKGLSEEEAHKALRKLAMDRKRKLADVADDLIAMSKLM
jgi:response regulator NasT